MRVLFFPALSCFLLFSLSGCGADKEKLYGKWELQEPVAGMPAGTIWEFRKDGKMIAYARGRTIEFGFSVSGDVLEIQLGAKKDTTRLVTLTDAELVCRDRDGTTAKFKRAK